MSQYQPKGSMCATCKYSAADCSNAHLIAAAPELYKALNAVMLWWHYGDGGDMPVSVEMAAVSAIAKARGES